MVHVIKRYSNRKMYSVEKSYYVTIGDIFDIVNNGEDLKVIDNVTGEDITLKTLKSGLHQLNINMDQVKGMICNMRKINENN